MGYTRENQSPLLEMKDFRVLFPGRKGPMAAVDGVDLSIYPGEIVGVVGESGSGKSVMSQSILRLREYETSVCYEGSIRFEGEDLLQLPLSDLRRIRGNRISVIFQDPLTSLSPVHTVGKQMGEVLRLHKKLPRKATLEKSGELLKLVGIPDPARCLGQYPYELSGGMQQRVMIAMALSCEPALLIADEPTTALDVTIQEQILDLIAQLNEKLGMSVLFITHDLSAMAQLCHSVRVMYLGQIVEEAETEELFAHPMHPYTQGLLACIPRLDVQRDQPLPVIEGAVPPLSAVPEGCHFCTRCPHATDWCKASQPPMVEVSAGHRVKCWNYTAPHGSEEEETR